MSWKNAMEWYSQGVLIWSTFSKGLEIKDIIKLPTMGGEVVHYSFTFEGTEYEAIVDKSSNLITSILI